ncbi:hypothetical protein AAVH_11347 [Aphelenchoides avenae]|nr:hypothetical protein AAVH_11347 [Aphelenchus avenae]
MLGLSAQSLWESFYASEVVKSPEEPESPDATASAEAKAPVNDTPTVKRSNSFRPQRWKCPLDDIRPDGVKVELKGDDLHISGQSKDSEKPSQLKRRVTLPIGVSKKSVKCYVDQHGKLSIEATYSSKPLGRSKSMKVPSLHAKPDAKFLDDQ